MINFKKIAAAVSLTGTLAGVGVMGANTSNASTADSYHTHYSASYGSVAECLANRTGAQSSAIRYDNSIYKMTQFTYIGSCVYSKSIHRYTYGHITWKSVTSISTRG